MPKQGSFIQYWLDQLRQSLAQVEALPQLSAIAVVIGAVCGLLIVAFRMALETPQFFLAMSSGDDFESLDPTERTFLLMAGSALIALILTRLNKYQRQLSVSHVIDRLHNHQGMLPTTNWLAQFILAVVAIGSGHSVGREGPAVHVGAGAASYIGRYLRLPNNSMQTLIACGVATGISASFDTPLAGVIFAMEVILMEYSIVGFVPVILASVIGAAISRGILGESVSLHSFDSSLNSLLELSLVAICGLLIAASAACYIRLNQFVSKFNRSPIGLRVLIAGLLTSAVATPIPEVMGLGYDTINLAIEGKILLSSLLLIAVAKLLLSPVVVALGIPGGLIGPSLLIGACIGAAFAALIQIALPEAQIDVTLYALLGMAGMMAATINAPLAALVAVLELSNNPHIIFPAMLIIVVSCINARTLFRVKGIFIEQLCGSGLNIELGGATRALQSIGVLSVMDRRFVICDSDIDIENARYALSSQPQWLLFSRDDSMYALWARDLANFLDQAPETVLNGETKIQLLEVPGQRHLLQSISASATLHDALKQIRKSHCDVLYVSANIHSHRSVQGVLSLQTIENYYQPKEMRDAPPVA